MKRIITLLLLLPLPAISQIDRHHCAIESATSDHSRCKEGDAANIPKELITSRCDFRFQIIIDGDRAYCVWKPKLIGNGFPRMEK